LQLLFQAASPETFGYTPVYVSSLVRETREGRQPTFSWWRARGRCSKRTGSARIHWRHCSPNDGR